jgi:SAM-dependent methyltransferase
MRNSIKDLVKICSETLYLPEPTYEFGALQVPGQEGFADMRPFFPGKRFVGADMREGPGVDVVLDLHSIDLPADSVGTILVLDTLEHVEYVWKAMEELFRILTRNGVLIMTSVMNFPIHDYPYDYWRFTPEAFRSLLKPFSSVFVDFAGDSSFPHTVVGVGFKDKIPIPEPFLERFTSWKDYYSTKDSSFFKGALKLITPPIILSAWRKLRQLVA